MELYSDTADIELIKDLYEGIIDGKKQYSRLIDGVTTNPSLLSQAALKYKVEPLAIAYKIVHIVDDNIPVSLETMGCYYPDYTPEGIAANRLYSEGYRIIEFNYKWPVGNLLIKIPTIPAGIEATYKLVKDFGDRARINSTLGFDYKQAIRAAQAGAYIFSLFMGRMRDENKEDAVSVAKAIIRTYVGNNFRTKFLAASMRDPELVIESWKAGADIATAPPHVIIDLVKRYPKEFEEMRQAHPPARTFVNPILPKKYDSDEFKHPLLHKGLKSFVEDGEKVGYNILETTVPV